MENALRLMRQGKKQEALSRLKQVVAQHPGDADAAVLLAQWLAAEGQSRRAETILFGLVAANPSHGKAHLVLAELLRMSKRHGEAEKHYREALRLLPDSSAAAYNLGLMLQLANRPQEAAEAYEEACRRAPAFAAAINNLAAMRLATGDIDAAATGFSRVIELDTGHLNARYNLGKIAEMRSQTAEAESLYVEVLRRNANHPQALYALASLLRRQNRNLDWAEKCYKAFIRQQPETSSGTAYNELGLVLTQLGRHDEAIPCFEAAVDYLPVAGSASARESLVNVLVASGRIPDAIFRLEQMLALWPENGNVLFDLVRLKLDVCDWSRLADFAARLAALPDAALPDAIPPYLALAVPGLSADTRSRITRRYAARMLTRMREAFGESRKPRKRGSRAVGKPIRLGYLFSGLQEIAPGDSLAGVIQHHDRDRFEIYAYSFSAADSGETMRHIAAAASVYRDLGQQAPEQFAETIRADRLDILVDLNGWTSDLHAPLLAAHPAPVVVGGWGYPASLGDRALADYQLADARVVPDTTQEDFAAKLLRLPGCYHPGLLPAELQMSSRQAEGLPQDAVVFAFLGPSHHLNPDVFDVWCTVLRENRSGVLWLGDPGEAARDALRGEARSRGIDPARLVFAAGTSAAMRRARPGLADVVLDTFPLNCTDTVLEALAAGVPVVTLEGDSFASRASAGILDAAGFGPLAARTPSDYVRIACGLTDGSGQLAAVRADLVARKTTGAVFDVAGYTRALESVLEEVVTPHPRA